MERGKVRHILKKGYTKAITIDPAHDVTAWVGDTVHLKVLQDALSKLYTYDDHYHPLQDGTADTMNLSARQKAYLDLDIHLLNGQLAVVFSSHELVTLQPEEANGQAIRSSTPVNDSTQSKAQSSDSEQIF